MLSLPCTGSETSVYPNCVGQTFKTSFDVSVDFRLSESEVLKENERSVYPNQTLRKGSTFHSITGNLAASSQNRAPGAGELNGATGHSPTPLCRELMRGRFSR